MKVSKDMVKDLDELEPEDLEGNGSKAKRSRERNAQEQRDSIARIKARAIAEGTARPDDLTVRFVDPATLRPPEEKPVTDRPRPPVRPPTTQPRPRPVDRAAMDAAGLPDEPVPPAPAPPPPEPPPSSESLRGRPDWQPPKREKKCKRCHLPFVPRSGNQRYCDRDECRTRECARDGCERRFEINNARPQQKFCSIDCGNLAQVKAPDSNPEQAEELPAGPPGAGELPPGPDSTPEPQPEAESEPEAPAEPGLEAQAPASGPPELPRDSTQEEAEAALASDYEAADARYVELLYSLVESADRQIPEGLRLRALVHLHDLWSERAVSGP